MKCERWFALIAAISVIIAGILHIVASQPNCKALRNMHVVSMFTIGSGCFWVAAILQSNA